MKSGDCSLLKHYQTIKGKTAASEIAYLVHQFWHIITSLHSSWTYGIYCMPHPYKMWHGRHFLLSGHVYALNKPGKWKGMNTTKRFVLLRCAYIV